MPVGKMMRVSMMARKKPQRLRLWGFFIPFWIGGLNPRLTTSYFFLSSHLQMRWQITPAIIERINDTSKSMMSPPFPTCIGVVAYQV